MKNKTMTLKEHLQTADELAIATHYLSKTFYRCQKYYPKSHTLMKFLYKILAGNVNGVFIPIKGTLDGEYQKIITLAQWEKYKDIYYNLEERYEKNKKSCPLYVDYTKSCEALKRRNKELNSNKSFDADAQ